MTPIDVFISYKREERALSDSVSQVLVDAGYVTVTDLNIQKATDFGEAIDTMIRDAGLVVVLWTSAATQSDWVKKEAIEADRLGKYFGVRVDKIEPDDLPFQVRNSQWLDISEQPITEGLSEILAEVRRMIGAPKQAPKEAETVKQVTEGDLEYFQVIDQVGMLEGYLAYRDRYPEGALSALAEQKIKELTSWRTKLRRIPGMALIATVAACVGAYASFQSIPKGPVDVSQLQTELAISNENLDTLREEQTMLAMRYERVQASFAAEENRRLSVERNLAQTQASLAEAQRDNQSLSKRVSELVSAPKQNGESDSGDAGVQFNLPDFGFSVATVSFPGSRNRGSPSMGLQVTALDESGEAFKRGLRKGDLISEVGQKKVVTRNQFLEIIEDARSAGDRSALILFHRDDRIRFVALSLL